MEKSKVMFKDFGKGQRIKDKENRDEALKAYICAIYDVYPIEFTDIIKHIQTEKDKESLIKLIYDDMKPRIERFVKED